MTPSRPQCVKKENKTVLQRPGKFTAECNGKWQNSKYIKRMANTDMKKQMQSPRHISEYHKDMCGVD